MKTYLVAVKIDSFFNNSMLSVTTEAESQNEAVRNVARSLLHIDSMYAEEFRKYKVEILSITEIEDVSGFKDTFTQRYFKEVD